MQELSRRERKKKDTYEKLFVTAMQLFRTRGFDATSIEQITQKADVGKGTFYNYFPSKEAVVLEFSRQAHRELIDRRRTHQAYSTRERLEVLLKDWADFMVADRELAWVAVRNREMSAQDLNLHYGLQAIITLGQREGEISGEYDSAFLAETLEGMMLQHFISWYVSHQGDLHQEMRHVLAVFMDGLGRRQRQA
ncbi:TetR/AcrR family transcriptional regulator [Paradesulfitobacterium aromaticivorans]